MKASISRWLARIIVAVVTTTALLFSLAYATTPEAIRDPKQAHYHLRVQVLVDGKAVDFAKPAFQTEYSKDVCSAELTKVPFHFHDGLDQFLHVHWDDMTGGLFLKHYGWNMIGGIPGALGIRIPKGDVVRVPVQGNVLPERPDNSNLYIFTGNAEKFTERKSEEFIEQDLETFFDGSAKTTSFWDRLFPPVLAHDGEAHSDPDAPDSPDREAELTRLNNVIGSVVIFAQDERPTDAQISKQFDQLVELPESSCGG